MAGDERGRQPLRNQPAMDRQADGQNRRLRILGQRQGFNRALETERAERLAERLVGLFERGTSGRRRLRERLAHADSLRTLSGKDECNHERNTPAVTRRITRESKAPGESDGLSNRVTPRLLFIDRAGLSSAVVAAVGADTMRLLLLVTMRAFGQADRLERIVRPALGRPRLGVSSFWIRHRQSLILPERAHAKQRATGRTQRSSPLPALSSQFRSLSSRSAARRGSSHAWVQAQAPRFKFVPHTGHRPPQFSRHNGFIGSDK